MLGPPLAVETSHYGCAKGRLPRSQFCPKVSTSAQRRSQQYGWNLHGPFLRALLLATVELSARAMAALIRKPGQNKLLCYVPFFFEKRKVVPPPPAPTFPPSSITKLKITHLFILYEYLFTCIN